MEASGDSGNYQQRLRVHMDGDNTVLQLLAQGKSYNRRNFELQCFHHAFRRHRQWDILCGVGKKDIYRPSGRIGTAKIGSL